MHLLCYSDWLPYRCIAVLLLRFVTDQNEVSYSFINIIFSAFRWQILIYQFWNMEQQPQSELVSLVCYICQSVMRTQRKYKKHLAKLHNKPAFQCKYCSHGCLSKKMLKFHRRTVCKSESLALRSYTCKLCPMTYSYRPALSRHRMSEHRNDDSKQKNVCKICQKSFSRRIYLQEHMSRCQKREGREIVREKHLCDKCQKEYASASSLNYHIKTIHDKKLFFCQCGEHFRWSRYLYIHMKTSCQYVA